MGGETSEPGAASKSFTFPREGVSSIWAMHMALLRNSPL